MSSRGETLVRNEIRKFRNVARKDIIFDIINVSIFTHSLNFNEAESHRLLSQILLLLYSLIFQPVTLIFFLYVS